jgi:hypothetical protein
MAGELKLNQVATPTTPASGKNALFSATDKVPHWLDEAGAVGLLSPAFIMRLTAAYTLTSNTTSQKAFNVPANGAITLASNTSYFFECLISMDTMSATSGNFGFDILGAGSATISNQLWMAHGLDATTQTTPAAVGGTLNAAALTTDVVVAATGTAAHVLIRGTFSVTTGGTIIPSVKLTTANAAVMKVGSYFLLQRIGLDTMTTQGPVS